MATRPIPIKPWWPLGNISQNHLTYCHKIKYAQFITRELIKLDFHSIIIKQIDSKPKNFNTTNGIIDKELHKIFTYFYLQV
jgi:hypothetical protein